MPSRSLQIRSRRKSTRCASRTGSVLSTNRLPTPIGVPVCHVLYHNSHCAVSVADAPDWRDVVLCFDGELRFFKAATELLQQQLADSYIRVHLFKFSAACSKTQQPQDVGTCFMTFRKISSLLFSPDLLNEQGYRFVKAHAHYAAQVERALKAFDTPSQKVFRPLLAYQIMRSDF